LRTSWCHISLGLLLPPTSLVSATGSTTFLLGFRSLILIWRSLDAHTQSHNLTLRIHGCIRITGVEPWASAIRLLSHAGAQSLQMFCVEEPALLPAFLLPTRLNPHPAHPTATPPRPTPLALSLLHRAPRRSRADRQPFARFGSGIYRQLLRAGDHSKAEVMCRLVPRAVDLPPKPI
jgi:hypothetical protein